MKTRRDAKADAERAARALMEASVKTSGKDLALAKRQADLARKVMLRYNVRFDYSLKRFVCHDCKELIVPGVNARVRLGHGKPTLLRVTCMMCGHTSRKILKMA